jgi:hypothetical protein
MRFAGGPGPPRLRKGKLRLRNEEAGGPIGTGIGKINLGLTGAQPPLRFRPGLLPLTAARAASPVSNYRFTATRYKNCWGERPYCTLVLPALRKTTQRGLARWVKNHRFQAHRIFNY